MKKLLALGFVLNFILVFCQADYKKIETEKLDTKKVLLSRSFIQSYLEKCLNKDYSASQGFKFSGEFEKFFNNKLREVCESNRKHYGNITLENLNSAYRNKTSIFGNQELYIFDAKTEKDKSIRYLSVWISADDTIDGMVITGYKPFKKR